MLILSSNAWFFSIPPKINLPIQLESIMNNFNKFYNQIHNGRKLCWIHQHSKGDLQTLYTKPKYILHVSKHDINN